MRRADYEAYAQQIADDVDRDIEKDGDPELAAEVRRRRRASMPTGQREHFDGGPHLRGAWRPRPEAWTPTAPYTAHPGETSQCPQCRSVNDDTAAYCDQCGTAIHPAGTVSNLAGVEETTQCCGLCGTWNSSDAKYCRECGHELLGDRGADPVTQWMDARMRELLALT